MCAMEHFKIIMFQFLTTQQVHFKIYPTFFFYFGILYSERGAREWVQSSPFCDYYENEQYKNSLK